MRLVLLHGFTGSPRSFEGLAARLGAGASALAPASLGHEGPRPAPPSREAATVATFDDEVARLLALVRAADLRGATLVGYSLGARLGLAMLAADPGLFDRAVLVGAQPGLRDPAARAARVREDEARARLLESEGVPAFVRRWEREPLLDTQRALPAEVAARRRAERESHDAAGLARSLRVLGLGRMPDLSPRLARVRAHVDLVAGERDPRFVAHAEALARALPRAAAHLIPGAGHDVLLERPDELARLVARAAQAA